MNVISVEFLKLEMNIREDEFNTLEIKKIFPPAKEGWDKLYVEFRNQISVNTIYRYAKYLRKDQRLVPYIPHQFYDRYRAMERIAYELRHSEPKYKTRVKMGSSDLILYKKKPGESTWTVLTSPTGLPAVRLDTVVVKKCKSSQSQRSALSTEAHSSQVMSSSSSLTASANSFQI